MALTSSSVENIALVHAYSNSALEVAANYQRIRSENGTVVPRSLERTVTCITAAIEEMQVHLQTLHGQRLTRAKVAEAGWPSSSPSEALGPASRSALIGDVRAYPSKGTGRCKDKREAQADQFQKQQQQSSLSDILATAVKEDPELCVVVRRTNKLGPTAMRSLLRHFSQFSDAATPPRVLLSYSLVRGPMEQRENRNAQKRKVPGSLGLLIMASAMDAQSVLASGPVHEINGVQVTVQKFVKPNCNKQILENEGPILDLDDACCQTSSSSGAASSVTTGALDGFGVVHDQSLHGTLSGVALPLTSVPFPPPGLGPM